MEAFRALKLSRLESVRALKSIGQIGDVCVLKLKYPFIFSWNHYFIVFRVVNNIYIDWPSHIMALKASNLVKGTTSNYLSTHLLLLLFYSISVLILTLIASPLLLLLRLYPASCKHR